MSSDPSLLPSAIAIIGGSGLYDIEGFENPEELTVDTPYGPPSDTIMAGNLCRPSGVFPPSPWQRPPHPSDGTQSPRQHLGPALTQCPLDHAVTAVGSLQEKYHPRDILLPDQFLTEPVSATDTLFWEGIVAHISFGDPISTGLRTLLHEEAVKTGARVHNGGVYTCMDGPAFSTRAESEAHRQLGFDIIGMTNLPEAKLAREAEIALATLAMITDYDCWKIEEEPVTAEAVVGHLMANAAMAKKIISTVIPRIPLEPNWPEHRALDSALITDQKLWPEATSAILAPILGRFLK